MLGFPSGQATSGKLFIGARAQIFLAADVATRTLRLAALALFCFYTISSYEKYSF